jgi:hypothetical protein
MVPAAADNSGEGKAYQRLQPLVAKNRIRAAAHTVALLLFKT